MPEKKNNVLGDFAEAIRKQLHEHDIRLTKIETTNRNTRIAIGIVLLLATLAVSIVAVHNGSKP